MAPAPAELSPQDSCHAVWYICLRAVVAAELSTRTWNPSSCALPTPSPLPSTASAAFVPVANATVWSTPTAGPRISTPSTANGKRQLNRAVEVGWVHLRVCQRGAPPQPSRRLAVALPNRLQRTECGAELHPIRKYRSVERRGVGYAAAPLPRRRQPQRPPRLRIRCRPLPSRCAPRTCRPQTARTPPTPRRPPPAPAAAGRTRQSAPRPPQRKGPRRSMPRAPSPGRPRQGRRCAHARGGRPPARAAGRPRAYGRGPRSSSEPAVDAAAADGPDQPIKRRAGGSAAPLYRSRQTLPRRPTCSAVPRARACRCTQTTTRHPPAHPPRPAPSPSGQLAVHTPRRCAMPRPPAD
eukprot:scaffold40864_cov59-Phaeocystis_antarctica.AAC.2